MIDLFELGYQNNECIGELNKILYKLQTNDSSLEKLDFSYHCYGNRILELFISNLNYSSSLKEINFTSINFNYLFNKLVEELIRNESIKKLNLSLSRISNIDEISLLIMQNKTITDLDLSSCSLNYDNISKIISALMNNTTINKLNLSNNNIQNFEMKEICQLLKLSSCSLEELNLSNNCLRDDSIMDLINGLEYNTRLKYIDISSNKLTNNGINKLIIFLDNKNIKYNLINNLFS